MAWCAGALLSIGARAGDPAPVVSRAVIASGGGVSHGGTFRLRDTIGQPLAHGASTGGPYRLRGGFWVASPEARPAPVFADGFEALAVAAVAARTSAGEGR